MKSVHVELPYEGGVIVVLEQFWYQCLGKFVFVDDYEGISTLRPSDEVGIARLVKKATVVSDERSDLGRCLTCSAFAQKEVSASALTLHLSLRLQLSDPDRRTALPNHPHWEYSLLDRSPAKEHCQLLRSFVLV